jgi:hypothetical protein
MSQDCLMTAYGPEGQDSITRRGRNILLSHRVKTIWIHLWIHPDSNPMGSEIPLLGERRLEREENHSPPSSSEV